MPTPDRRKPAPLRRASVACLLALCILLAHSGRGSESDTAPDTRPPAAGGDFTLTDQDGQPFTLSSQRGKLVLIFFGYTYCPDICPTELATLSRLLHDLDQDADRVTSLFITVDPERDTPQKLRQYVPFYHPRLIGLSGSREAIDKVTTAYHVQYRIHPHKTSDRHYLVDHSASLYVVNPDGVLDQIIPFGLPYEHVENLVRHKLAEMK